MIDVERIVDIARTYRGTRFHHHGRVKGAGVDCAGLIVCSYRDAGLEIADARYIEADQYALLIDTLSFDFVRIESVIGAALGDVLVFRQTSGPVHRRIENHAGIVSSLEPLSMIHAPPMRGVVEAPVSAWFLSTTVLVFRYKGS